MIVLIDNYDSFSYNVYQLIGSVEPDIKVVRNDEVTIEELEKMKPEALILSPGPGRPEDAGICIDSIKYFKDPWHLPWSSVHLQSLRRHCFLRKRTDARQTERNPQGG